MVDVKVFAILMGMIILVNFGVLVSLGLLLNMERKINVSFRSMIIEYSKAEVAKELIKEYAIMDYENQRLYINISSQNDDFKDIKKWLES